MLKMNNPLDQFKIVNLIEITLGGVDFSFTNSSLALILAALCIAIYSIIVIRKRELVPSYLQSSAEILYVQIKGMLDSTIGSECEKYLPLY